MLSPSSSKRWLSCPPSARLCARIQEHIGESSSVFAEEGTKAHSLAELKLRKEIGEINDFLYEERVKALGELPSDMEWATNTYVDIVMQKYYEAKKKCPDAQLLVEVKLDMCDWVPECKGTSDSVVVSDSGLEVIDYKHGAGVPVDAVGNTQARLYALGAVKEFGDLYGFKDVRYTIVQPRLDSVTEETVTKDWLLDWGASIKPTAELAFSGEGEFKAGDHCKFCLGKPVCRARALEAMKAFQYGFESPDILDDDSIPEILKVSSLAKEWLNDLEDYAKAKAIKGKEWRGFKLVHGRRPPRAFTSDEEAMVQLTRAGYTEADYMCDPKMRSVADIEKRIGKKNFSALLGGLTVQGDGALTLVPEDDKRPEVRSADVAFADLAE